MTLEDELKFKYIALRRKKIPYYKGGKDLDKVIPKAVELLNELRISVDDYLAAIKKYSGLSDLFPNILGSSQVKAWVSKFTEECTLNLKTVFQVQQNYMLCALKNGRTVEDVLMDDQINLKPWFRILITKKAVPEVIGKYGSTAEHYVDAKLRKFCESQKLDITRITEWEKYV